MIQSAYHKAMLFILYQQEIYGKNKKKPPGRLLQKRETPIH